MILTYILAVVAFFLGFLLCSCFHQHNPTSHDIARSIVKNPDKLARALFENNQTRRALRIVRLNKVKQHTGD